MEISRIDLGKLKPADYNPRVELKPGDVEYEKLKRSFLEFGYVEPIIWNKQTGNVVGGHQRLSVLRDLGEKQVECVIVNLPLVKEKALNVALNKIQGRWDDEKLAALLTDLDNSAFDVSLTGFDATEVDELMNQFYSREAIEDDFDYQEAHDEIKAKGAVSKKGEVWQLGNHRLICGNPTDENTIAKLLSGKKAQLCVSCPPGITRDEYTANGIEPWLAKMKSAIRLITKSSETVCWVLGDMYNTQTPFIEPTAMECINAFAETGLRPLWIRVWKKQQTQKSSSGYHLKTDKPIQQYEYISAFGGNNEAEYNDQEYAWISAFAGHSFKFVRRLSKDERKKWGYAGIWEMTPVKTFSETQTAAPIELPWRCVKMHSDKGAIVLDPFCGTGTTLIACEQTDRICYAIEDDTDLCDMIVKRWEQFTWQKARCVC